MEKQNVIDEVPYSLLKLIMHYIELEKKIKYYGTDKPIYNSEIHMISAIGNNPDINVKGLAKHFNITSASASEMLSKLQKKGLIVKTVDKDHRTSLKLSLTQKGVEAHKEHIEDHKKLNNMVLEELSNVSQEEIENINNFLKNMNKRLDEFDV